METNLNDLFYEYNKRLSENIRQKQVKDVVVIGPPKSGKTFFIENYLNDLNVDEKTIGVLEVDVSKWNLMDKLKESINDLGNNMKKFFGGGSEDLESLGIIDIGDVSGIKLPKEYVNHLKELKSRGKLIVFYFIPPTEVKEIARILDEEKVKFIWLGKEYIPPGLLKLMNDENKLREQLRLYKKLNKLFGINVEKGIPPLSLSERLVKALVDKAPDFVSFIAGRFGRLLQSVSLLVGVLITALIFDKLDNKSELYKTLLEAIYNWSSLDEDLRQLTAANLSFIMRLTPKVVYESMEKLSNEDVKKEIEKLTKYVEEKVEKVERKGDLSNFGIVYPRVNGDDLIGLGVYNGKVYEGSNKYQLVTTRFDYITKKVKEKLLKERIIVVRGPKGVGKSTLTHYVISQLLQSGEFTWAVKVGSDINPSDFNVKGDKVLFFYDFYPYEMYTPLAPAGKELDIVELKDIIENLRKLVKNSENTYVIVVIPDDILKIEYEDRRTLKKFRLEEVINSLPQVNVDLHYKEFIKGIVESFSGCKDVSDIVELIFNNYNGGYTLVAKYAGLLLRDKGCKYEDVREILEQSKGDPIGFLKIYINELFCPSNIYPNNVTECRKQYAIPLMIHVFLGEVPVRVSEKLPKWLNVHSDDYYSTKVAPWIASKKEELVEEALKEHLKDLINNTEVLKEYFSENEKLKEIIKSTDESIEDYLTELKKGGVDDSDLDIVKASISYDKGLWTQATQDFYKVLKGWVSGNDNAFNEYETTIRTILYEIVIRTILYAVIREFLRDKLLGGEQKIDKPTLELLLRLAYKSALRVSAADLFDEASDKLKEYIFAEDREAPVSIRLAVHGFPLFINGLFNEYKSDNGYINVVNSSWCEYLKLAEVSQEVKIPEVAAGAALYLLSIPEELSDDCKENIIEIIRDLQSKNPNYFINTVDNVFLYFLVKNKSLTDKSILNLSVIFGNIGVMKLSEISSKFLKVLLEVSYDFRENIKDNRLKAIYVMNIIGALLILYTYLQEQIDEPIVKEAKNLLNQNDDILLYNQIELANRLMIFYLKKEFINELRELEETLKALEKRIENTKTWNKVLGWFKSMGIDMRQNVLKEKAKYVAYSALARYYHELHEDIKRERDYIDAAYHSIINVSGGEEIAKDKYANEYFSVLLKRDVLNAVLGKNLRESIEKIFKDSEEALNYSILIGMNALELIIREYLISSAYLGRLDEASKIIGDDYILRDSLLDMYSSPLLGLYSLLSLLTREKFLDEIREYAKIVSNEILSFERLIEIDKILINIAEKPISRRAIIEVFRGLMKWPIGLNCSDISYLIYRLIDTKPGNIALLYLSTLFFNLEGSRELAECLAEYMNGKGAELLVEVSKANDEKKFKDTLVKLAIYWFL